MIVEEMSLLQYTVSCSINRITYLQDLSDHIIFLTWHCKLKQTQIH